MRYWYFPLKLQYFDFVKCLYDHDSFDLRMFSNYKFKIGDILFIYSGEPHSQFLYLMGVVKTNIPFEKAEVYNELRPQPIKSTVNNWMRLQLLKSVPIGTKSLQSAQFSKLGYRLIKYPKLIKDKGVLQYLYDEFDRHSCD